MLTAEGLFKFAFGLHLLLNVIDVVEIVGQGAIDIAEGNAGYMGHYLVRSHALVLMPHHDIKHTNAVTRNAGFSAANIG